MKWLMAIVIAAGLIRLGDTQPPDDSREPDEGRRRNRGWCSCCATVEQDACEMTDIEEQQDTQAQASSNGTEASGYAVQTSLDDNKEDKEFVEKLTEGWDEHALFVPLTELRKTEINYLKLRGSQKSPAPDGDVCCETYNELQPQCGDKKDIYNTEWFVICPEMKDGKRHVQYADVGTCA
nr:hypothetical protein BaRGS_015655 [Batillaria attramentaria]